MPLAVVFGGAVHDFLERAGEVAVVIEADALRNIRDGMIGRFQQGAACIDPHL